MAIDEDIPVWPFEANWSEEIRETLEWMTDIITSPIGAEQRRSLRKYPRRTLEYSTVLQGTQRSIFDVMMMKYGGGDWYLPIAHDVHVFGAEVSGSTIELSSIINSEIRAGHIVIIRDADDPFSFELAEVATLVSDDLTLVAPLANTWPAGSRMLPVRIARFTDQPVVERYTDNATSMQLRFMMAQANDDVSTIAASLTYRDFEVLASSPEQREKLEYGYDRMFEELDNGLSVPLRRDTAAMAFPRQKYAWTLAGRSQHRSFRALLHRLRGRAIPIWLPTFFADFEIAATTAAGSNLLTVKDVQFTALGGPSDSRQDIVIELVDGTQYFRRITGSAVLTLSRERLTLDSTIPVELTAANVLRISFMALCRLDQDTVEIVHQTDIAGVSIVDTTFRAAPDLRVLEEA